MLEESLEQPIKAPQQYPEPEKLISQSTKSNSSGKEAVCVFPQTSETLISQSQLNDSNYKQKNVGKRFVLNYGQANKKEKIQVIETALDLKKILNSEEESFSSYQLKHDVLPKQQNIIEIAQQKELCLNINTKGGEVILIGQVEEAQQKKKEQFEGDGQEQSNGLHIKQRASAYSINQINPSETHYWTYTKNANNNYGSSHSPISHNSKQLQNASKEDFPYKHVETPGFQSAENSNGNLGQSLNSSVRVHNMQNQSISICVNNEREGCQFNDTNNRSISPIKYEDSLLKQKYQKKRSTTFDYNLPFKGSNQDNKEVITENKSKQKQSISELIKMLMDNMSVFSDEELVQVEDLIIQLHSHSVSQKGMVPQELILKLEHLNNKILVTKETDEEAENKKIQEQKLKKSKSGVVLGELQNVYQDLPQVNKLNKQRDISQQKISNKDIQGLLPIKSSEDQQLQHQLNNGDDLQFKTFNNEQMSQYQQMNEQLKQKYKDSIPESVLPFFESHQDLEIRYLQILDQYKAGFSNISQKQIKSYKQLVQPNKQEQSLGSSLILLFASVDQQIALSSDKNSLQDKNWSQSIGKYLNNSGKVIQNLRKMKELFDSLLSPLQDSHLIWIHLKEVRNTVNEINNGNKGAQKLREGAKELYMYLVGVLQYTDYIKYLKEEMKSEVVQKNGQTQYQTPFTQTQLLKKKQQIDYYSKSVTPKKDQKNQSEQQIQQNKRKEEDQQIIVVQKQRAKCSGKSLEKFKYQSGKALNSGQISQRKVIEVNPLYDQFKYAINNKIFDENLNFDKKMGDKKKELVDAKKIITKLKGQEKAIKWGMQRKDKEKKKEQERIESMNYMQYQQDLRQRLLSFLKEKAIIEREQYIQENKQKIVDFRLLKMREDAEYKVQLIQEFKQTLDDLEWSDKLKEEEKQKRLDYHFEFLQNIQVEKIFKQQVYAVEKMLEQDERMQLRKGELDYQHLKLLKEQQELIESIEFLKKCNFD